MLTTRHDFWVFTHKKRASFFKLSHLCLSYEKGPHQTCEIKKTHAEMQLLDLTLIHLWNSNSTTCMKIWMDDVAMLCVYIIFYAFVTH